MPPYILSVVIPTYNTEPYLERCIDSLLDERINGQVEIIIVNDGSTDGSLAIANRYATQYPFVVVVDKPNGGHGSTINKGIELAHGKYFRVLDSDDWFDTDQFVAYLSELENITADAVITWGYIEQVYANKKEPYTLFQDDSAIEYGKLYTFETFDFRRKYIVMAQLTYQTNLVKNIPKPLLEKTFYVDNEFLLYPMLHVHTFVFLNYYIYHYFIGRPEQSMSKAMLERNVDHIRRVSSAIMNFLQVHPMADGPQKDYMHYIATHVIRTYYVYLLSYFPYRRIWAYRLLKNWDKQLFDTVPTLYARLNSDLYINLYRRLPLVGSLVSPYLYIFYTIFKHR